MNEDRFAESMANTISLLKDHVTLISQSELVTCQRTLEGIVAGCLWSAVGLSMSQRFQGMQLKQAIVLQLATKLATNLGREIESIVASSN